MTRRNHEIIADLKAQGYILDIFHYRYPGVLRSRYGRIRPYAGMTSVAVFPDDLQEEVAAGVAYCSPKDQFCKRTGLAIALGRALKQLEQHERF